MSLYVVNRDGTGLRRLSEDEARLAPPAGGELSKDKTLTVFTEEGDIFIYDHAKGARRQVTRTTDTETNARFTADQKRIYFTRQNNLYVIALDGGSLVQLTDIRTGGASSPGGGPPMAAGGGFGGAGAATRGGTEGQQRGTESQEYIKKEERELLEAVRERAAQREEQEAKRKQREKRKPFNAPPGQTVTNLTLAPDGTYVIATIGEQGTGAKNAIVPNFVTESAYTEDIPGRTKVGDAQGRTRMVVINAETGDVKNVDHGQREVATVLRTRTELNTTEQAQRERGETQAQTGPPPQTGQQAEQQGQQQTVQGPPPRTQTERTQAATPRDRDVQLFQLQWSEDGK
ncbi:MAG: DPP IV N-terminal domain-containing protein, partial [Acidobacteria bacterium]|nr:DPP IV N-terminal domain-containing protein [Acidobacteriota bacterium]